MYVNSKKIRDKLGIVCVGNMEKTKYVDYIQRLQDNRWCPRYHKRRERQQKQRCLNIDLWNKILIDISIIYRTFKISLGLTWKNALIIIF